MTGRDIHTLAALYLPLHLPPGRLLVWCRRRTQMNAIRARRRGKSISAPNLRRLLQRRLHRAGLMERIGLDDD